MSQTERILYEFGAFCLDPDARLLLRDGAPLHLQPKVFETLLLLIEQRMRALSKDELMQKLWPDCLVEEGSLTQLVFQARRALGEEAGRQQFIRTVPRHGYQFVADVTVLKSEPREIVVTHRHGATIRIEEELDDTAVATTQPGIGVELQGTTWRQRLTQRRVMVAVTSLLVVAGGL